ncbi:hypothetical protein L6452_14332 [Arctium lappa]|uniref:Uncharacterized protein n=1 Tax=Arctium lappa TaxID=4217 RepID=A0ACB9CKP7_ARCLA|nr:hypothetical protein L6452_14332 [Arctium lappa]
MGKYWKVEETNNLTTVKPTDKNASFRSPENQPEKASTDPHSNPSKNKITFYFGKGVNHQKRKPSPASTCGEKAKPKDPLTTPNMGIDYTIARDKRKEIEVTDGTNPISLTLSLEDMKSKIFMGDLKSKKDIGEWTNLVPQKPIPSDTFTTFPTFNQKDTKTSPSLHTVGGTLRDPLSPLTKNNNHLLHAHATSHHPWNLANPMQTMNEFSRSHKTEKESASGTV